MRKIKEVLRLRYELGLGLRRSRAVARLARQPLLSICKRAEAAGLRWPLPDDWDDERLEGRCCMVGPATASPERLPMPDFVDAPATVEAPSDI